MIPRQMPPDAKRAYYAIAPHFMLRSPTCFYPFDTDSLTFVEKQCDDFYLDIVKSAKNVLYGPEPLGAYIVAREYEVRNLRIVVAGKLSGLRAETIKERLRSSYV